MLLNLLNWCWIFISTYITGWAVTILLGRVLKCNLKRLEDRIATGLVFTGIYAEYFSLIYKVGIAATLGLAALCLISLFIVRKDIRPTFRQFRGDFRKASEWMAPAACCIGIFFLLVSASMPYHGDTYLYHIQAVKWIEQYGVVKGLGNLHFRLAYNSAFECLAALYSWSSWGTGMSLHAVNGFYAALMVTYCVLGFRWRPGKGMRIPVSDLLRVSTVIYIFGRLLSYGSADTDPLVMHCIAFIFIRWFELLGSSAQTMVYRQSMDKGPAFSGSDDCESLDRTRVGTSGTESDVRTDQFALLVMFGVYACTVKLSAAPILILALSPIVRLFRKKRARFILLYLLLAVLIAAPYLARNVLISGYLIYPVTAIDLFNVDWKMPESVVRVDRDGIIMWGRAIQNESDPMSMGVIEWLPVWFASLNVQGQILFIGSVMACICWLVHVIHSLIKGQIRKEAETDFTAAASIVCFLFWMSSAPLLRYGELYMWIVIMAVFGSFLSAGRFLLAAATLVLLAEAPSAVTMNLTSVGLAVPADYDETFGMVRHETGLYYDDGTPVVIYTPDEGAGGQSDYWYFPETPEQEQLDSLEFRGNSLEEGFRSSLSEKNNQ